MAAIATIETVTRAKAELEALGLDVTQDTVRERLGGGSKSTISRHLAALRAEPELPPMPAAVEVAFKQAWRAALGAVDGVAEEVRVELDGACDQIERLSADLAASAADLAKTKADAALEKAEAEKAILEARAAEEVARSQVISSEQDLAVLRAERALLVADKERLLAEVAELRTEAKTWQKELLAAQKELAAAHQARADALQVPKSK